MVPGFLQTRQRVQDAVPCVSLDALLLQPTTAVGCGRAVGRGQADAERRGDEPGWGRVDGGGRDARLADVGER